MKKGTNLHFPPELEFKNARSNKIHQIFSQWKSMQYTEPKMVSREFRATDHGPEAKRSGVYEFNLSGHNKFSPSGLLYRTVLNSKFVDGVVRSSLRAYFPNEDEVMTFEISESGLSYGSGFYSSGIFTSTSVSIKNSIIDYRPGFEKHSEGLDMIKRTFDVYGLNLTKVRLLLLAIDPRDNHLVTDADGVGAFSIEGRIPLQNIFILNDNPKLLDQLLGFENFTYNGRLVDATFVSRLYSFYFDLNSKGIPDQKIYDLASQTKDGAKG